MKKIKELIFLLLLPLLLSGCDSLSDGHEWDLTYIPVQIETGDPISLIDSKGNIVVKEEYDAENTVSRVFKGTGKLYWVGNQGKKQLYSIDHPKTPISSEEYDQVTYFVNNRAVVVREGKPIEIINEQGTVIKSLSNNITSATVFQGSGVSVITTSDNGMGWIDKDGNIISRGFESVMALRNGLVIARKDADSTLDIYLADGTKTGSIAKDMVLGTADLYEPNFLVYRKDEDGKKTDCQVIDKNGNKKYDINVHFDKAPVFCDGYIIFEKDDRYGVIDNNGEEIIRAKYYYLDYGTDKKQFIARKTKTGDLGVINDKDECILPFAYKMIEPFGDNYLIKQEQYNIVDKEGRELVAGGFKDLANGNVLGDVHFFDADGFADIVVSTIDKTNLDQTASQVAKMLNRDEPRGEYYQIKGKDTELMGFNATTKYAFDRRVSTDSIKEEKGDTVFHKYVWNERSVIETVYITVFLENISEVSNDIILRAIRKEMEEKNYSYHDGLFALHDRTVRIRVDGYTNSRKLEIRIEKVNRPGPAEAR